jgi:hypothetical protein
MCIRVSDTGEVAIRTAEQLVPDSSPFEAETATAKVENA